MATTSVTLSGFVYDNAGNAVQDATVTAYTSADNATSAISGLTDTTDANGRWDITTTNEAQYPMDIKIAFGSAVRWIKAGNGINITRLTVSGDAVFGEDDTGVDVTMYGATSGRYLLWDESEDALHLNDNTELKVGSLAAGDMVLYHDGTNSYIKNATGALKIATESSGIAVTIGHTTSEVTVADNLTVTGNLTVSGTQTIVDTVTMNAANAIVFEGATADGYETTLTIEDPTADRTVVIPNVGGTLAVLAADSDTAITATPAELNLIDGGTARGTTAIADGDGVLINDDGTMRMTTVQTLATYMEGEINALSLGVTFSGASTFSNTVTVGEDDTGYDVKFFGATASAFMLWDQSEDDLVLSGTAQLSIDTATDASSTTTGSFHTDGGVGIAKKLYVGTDLDVAGTSNIEDTVVLGTLTVGVDDTGHDVKFFGASAGAYMEWDESADQLRIMGASADATTSTGKLLLATSLTDVNANDVIGKIDFQAPHEAGGTDAIEIAASIQAIAQGTFSASVNATDLIFYTGHSEAATEKFRFTSQGELGIGGATYGSSGDVLTSGGAGAAPTWETPTTGDITGVTAGTGLSGGGSSGSVTLNVDASQTGITSVGALDAGSITSNFGTINNGSSTITTTGAVATGALTPSSIAFTGNLYLTGTLTTASNTNNYMVRFNEADSSVTASAANSGTGASGYAFVAIDGEAIAAASSYTFAESSSLMITGPPTAGTNMTLTQTFALNVVAGDVSIAPTAKLFLDGGGDTYIYEESDDDLHIVVGNVAMMQFDQDIGATVISADGSAPLDQALFSLRGAFTSGGGGTDAEYFLLGGTLNSASGDTRNVGVINIDTQINTQAVSETTTAVASLIVNEPNITKGSGHTITTAASIYVVDAPTEGNTNNAAIYVASGDTNLKGKLLVGDGDVDTANSYSALVIEKDDYSRLEFLNPTDKAATIWFSDTTEGMGRIEYTHGSTATNEYMSFATSATERMRLDSAGTVFIGDTLNGNMTIGLTINQGANDNQILALKSSDVGHGATSIGLVSTEIDDFAVISKASAGIGGWGLTAISDGADLAASEMFLVGGNVSTNKTTGGLSAGYRMWVSQHNGSNGLSNIISNGNLFAINAYKGSAWATVWIIDEDGDYFYDGADGGAFDSYDDASLTRAMSVATGGNDIIRDEWDKYVDYNEADLVKAGVLGDTMANGGLVNGAAMQRLHTGAIWQLNTKHMSLAEEVASLRGDLAIANQKLNALGA